jgi:CRP/FNR family transcriptional regulator
MTKNPTKIDLLTTNGVFSQLSDTALTALAEAVLVKQFSRGEFLFAQDTLAKGFYSIIQGKIEIFRLSPEGRQQILHVFGPGDLAGEVPVFQGGKYPATASAATNCKVLYIPGDKFLTIAQSHPEVLLEMLAVLSLRLRKFVALIDDLSLKEVSARLSKHILDLTVKANSPTVELDSTKATLAAKLGTIAETISRTLNKMQTKGILQVQGRKITVLNTKELTAIAAGVKL